MTAKLLPTILKLALTCVLIVPLIVSAQSPAPSSAKKPNILVIFGDDIGQTNISAYSFGVMGYKTPNIDRSARTTWGTATTFSRRCTGSTSFFGNLYHLNAEEEPEDFNYPRDLQLPQSVRSAGRSKDAKPADKDDPTEDPRFGRVGKQTIEDTGPSTRKRMETSR